MKNIKLILGTDLLYLLGHGLNVERISSWADHLYWENIGRDLPELEEIAFMDAGPEFILTEEELRQIAQKWITEGEYEELGSPLVSVKHSAEDISQGWLYCPLCHEAWESASSYAMVRCPKCDSLLHNPKYKP